MDPKSTVTFPFCLLFFFSLPPLGLIDLGLAYLPKTSLSIQSGASYHSLGFEDEDLGSSPGWWAATVAIYCPSRPGETLQILIFKTLRMIGRPALYLSTLFGIKWEWDTRSMVLMLETYYNEAKLTLRGVSDVFSTPQKKQVLIFSYLWCLPVRIRPAAWTMSGRRRRGRRELSRKWQASRSASGKGDLEEKTKMCQKRDQLCEKL